MEALEFKTEQDLTSYNEEGEEVILREKAKGILMIEAHRVIGVERAFTKAGKACKNRAFIIMENFERKMVCMSYQDACVKKFGKMKNIGFNKK